MHYNTDVINKKLTSPDFHYRSFEETSERNEVHHTRRIVFEREKTNEQNHLRFLRPT